MTDSPYSIYQIGANFERFCGKVLIREGYNITDTNAIFRGKDGNLRLEVDIIGSLPNSRQMFIAEIKFYMTARSDRLFEAIKQLKNRINAVSSLTPGCENSHGILITNAKSTLKIEEYADRFKIDIWDIEKIRDISSDDNELSIELESILDYQIIDDAETSPWRRSEVEEKAGPLVGQSITDKLKSVQSGANNWRDFETFCEEAMKYLFSEEMHYWRNQHRIEDGFHRPDLLARIRDTGGIWSLLSRDHRTRYVVFEFKNYSRPITRDQIYSTEKYLFPNALRSIAVIVARSGADDGAKRAIRAALRGAGKLIIDIELEELFQMLKRKDDGGDASENIHTRVDKLLTDLAP